MRQSQSKIQNSTPVIFSGQRRATVVNTEDVINKGKEKILTDIINRRFTQLYSCHNAL